MKHHQVGKTGELSWRRAGLEKDELDVRQTSKLDVSMSTHMHVWIQWQ